MPDDLQEPVEDTTSTTGSSTTNPSSGQSNDFEARFKGLQREYNTLKNQLAGKEGHATTLQKELDSLKQQLADIAQKDQGQITQLSTERDTLQKQYESAFAERNTFEAQLKQFNRDKEVRNVLLQKNNNGETPFAGLLPLHEKGILNVGDRQGDDLTQFLTEAASLLGSQQHQRVLDVLGGANPPTVSPTTSQQMDVAAMQAWLMDPANLRNPQYPQIEEAYFQGLKPQ